MLLLGGRSITVEGITVFPDHADPDQFWYLPGPVQLARDEQDRASFTFIKYKPAAVSAGAKGGGFLTFAVELALPEDLERRLLSQLRRLSRNPRLTVAPFDEGTVQVVALDLQGSGGTSGNVPEGGFRAVEKIMGAAVPSLAGDNTAAFSLTLSQEGAIILEQAFEQGTTPVGVIYDLKYTGMRPALHVEITADLERVYTQFSASLEAQVYFVKAGIDAAFEKLVQEGAIKIKVIDFTGEADESSKEQWALDFFKNDLLSQWFTPTLTPGQVAGGQVEPEGLSAVVARAAAMRPPTTPAPPRPAATPPAPAAATTPATPNPAAGTGQGEAATAGLNVSPGDAPTGSAPSAGSGFPAGSTAAPTPAATGVQVPAAAPATGVPAAGGAGSTAVVSFKLRFVRQEERKKLTLIYDRSEATQRTYAPQGFFGLLAGDLDRSRHFVEVDLDDPFFRAFSVSAEAPFDFARIGLNSVHLALDYGDDNDPSTKKHGDFVFNAQNQAPQKFEVFMSPGLETSYKHSVQLHFDPDSGWEGERFSYEMPVAISEDRTLLINPHDHLAFLEIGVEASKVDWEVVDSIEVQLQHSDPLGNRDKTFIITEQAQTNTWRLRVEDRNSREYSYSFVHHLKDGTSTETEPVTTRATKVPVTDPFPGQLDIEFIPLLSASTTRLAFIDVQYNDDANDYRREIRLELEPASTETRTVSLALVNPELKQFRYRITLVGVDGSMRRGSFIETTETLIAVTEPAVVVD